MKGFIQANDEALGRYERDIGSVCCPEFMFLILPKQDDYLDPASKCIESVMHPRRQKLIVGSSVKVALFEEQYLSRLAKYDPNYMRGIPDQDLGKIMVWNKSLCSSSKEALLKSLLKKLGAQSRMSYSQSISPQSNWRAFLLLFSALDTDQLASKLSKCESDIKLRLSDFVNSLIEAYAADINPMKNYGVLSEQCIVILAHIADGKSVEFIAGELGLSERGVLYHIDRAKDILMATNRVNLISKAHRLKII